CRLSRGGERASSAPVPPRSSPPPRRRGQSCTPSLRSGRGPAVRQPSAPRSHPWFASRSSSSLVPVIIRSCVAIRQTAPSLYTLGGDPSDESLAYWLPDVWQKHQQGSAAPR